MKKLISLFLAAAIVFSFSSCSKMEIDKTAIIDSLYIYSDGGDLTFQFNTVENENTAVLEKYAVKAENLKEAREKLEELAVPYLFFGQLECVVFSRDLSINRVTESLEYFNGGYECSPGVNVLFAAENAMEELLQKNIPISRLTELCRLAKEEDDNCSLSVYSLYNSIMSQGAKSLKVGLLLSKIQLEVHSAPFYSIKSIRE